VNKRLSVLNILSIKYSMYDVKCDVITVCILCDMGKINVSDKILIENLRKQNRWDSKKLLREFLPKGRSRSAPDSLLRRINGRGSADLAVGSRRARSARTSANIMKVGKLVCSKEEAPGTHKSPWETEQMTGTARSSVWHILQKDFAHKELWVKE